MAHERPAPFETPKPGDEFGFTQRERFTWRVSDERLRALIEDEHTVIHRVELSANKYGEFLFLTVSLPEHAQQPIGERGSVVTFWGLGYHEYRERWLIAEWFWYEAFSRPELLEQTVSKDVARRLLDERRESIRPYEGKQCQSDWGKLFEMLADLTDDDGAYTEMQDLDDLAGWWEGDSG